MGTIISIFSASIMFILGGNIPHWLTPDPTLQRMIFDLLPLVRKESLCVFDSVL